MLEVLIDDGHCQKDTSSGTDSSAEISEDREGTDADSSESGGSWDVSIEVLDHGLFSHSFDNEFLVNKLSANILGAGARDVDPNSGEEGARAHNENGVDQSVDRVTQESVEALWRTDVVSKTTDWGLMTSHVVILPFSKERNDEVSSELSSKDLGEEVNVGNESSLQDNWDVRGVEQLDWVWLSETSHLLAAQRKLNSESLYK